MLIKVQGQRFKAENHASHKDRYARDRTSLHKNLPFEI